MKVAWDAHPEPSVTFRLWAWGVNGELLAGYPRNVGRVTEYVIDGNIIAAGLQAVSRAGRSDPVLIFK